MLRNPKTLPADATVADAWRALENVKVQMVLLVDGGRFRGALSRIPGSADPSGPAIDFVDDAPPTATEDAFVSDALDQIQHRPHGRVVVVDDDDNLVGLVCLAKDGKSFCGVPG